MLQLKTVVGRDAILKSVHGAGTNALWYTSDEAMRIEIVKRSDGAGVLRCTRDDGSITWQKQPKHGAHFALHDLTHYAVESTLGYRHGFFGLIADGWEIDETTGKGARGPLPPEAREVERIVGLFDGERAAGVLWTTVEFNNNAGRKLTEHEIQRIRAARAELFQRWFAVPAGEALQLEFDVRLFDLKQEVQQ